MDNTVGKSEMNVLLIGPFDPYKGLYSFVAPPLGIWRIAGFLKSKGIHCQVFDPNLSPRPYKYLMRLLKDSTFHAIGFSVTGMTLPYDLSLIHRTRQLALHSTLFAGGVEATFNYRLIMSIAPLDMTILGEGEIPILKICEALEKKRPLNGIQGTVTRTGDGLKVIPNKQLSFEEFREANFLLPLDEMPFETYWNRLKNLYEIKPDNMDDSKINKIHSIYFISANYCPLKCAFCSYTNFLDAACGKKGIKMYRLPAEDILSLVKRALKFHPDVRNIVFRDDLFILKNDKRIKPLCEGIVLAKENGELSRHLTFICSSRVDTISKETLILMKMAGFRLIGYGIESFSKRVLKEFNKDKTFNYIEPAISDTIEAGITPFLNIILSSPHSTIEDIVTTLSKVFEYQKKGCEVSIYPYVIPFSGAAMSESPDLKECKLHRNVQIPYTQASFMHPVKIMPMDPFARDFIEEMETRIKVDTMDITKELHLTHLPSWVRSIITVYSASNILKGRGVYLPFSPEDALALLKGI